MGKLIALEVENFKSYGRSVSIGPFVDFSAVIGPNGSGKRYDLGVGRQRKTKYDSIYFLMFKLFYNASKDPNPNFEKHPQIITVNPPE